MKAFPDLNDMRETINDLQVHFQRLKKQAEDGKVQFEGYIRCTNARIDEHDRTLMIIEEKIEDLQREFEKSKVQ